MSIRLGNSCSNCENLVNSATCSVHLVNVSNTYTCDSFKMNVALSVDPSCSTCVRYETTTCANPKKAAPEMSCSHWAPQNAMA